MAPTNRKKRIAGSLIMILMLGLCSCSSSSDSVSTAEYIQSSQSTGGGYQTAEVYEGSFDIEFTSEARVMYNKSQQLTWENGEDRYGEILVQQGQMVKKGDVLATFEVTSVSDSQIMEMQLAIQEAETSLSKTTQRYEEAIAKKQESMAELKDEDYQIAALELQKLRSEYAGQIAQAQYQKSQMQKALDELLEKKADNQLVAPFDGRISYVARNIQKGNKVEAGASIMIIEDLSSRVIVFTNNNYYGSVPYLSKVTLTDRVSKKEYTGTIICCGNVSEGESDNVIIELDTPLGDDWEGMFFEVKGYITQKSKVTLVDKKAIKTERNDSYVFVLTESNAIYKTYVSVGGDNGKDAWITEGLTPGQTVLIE